MPPPGAGGGRPSCLGGCPLYAKALRGQPTRREGGGGGGEGAEDGTIIHDTFQAPSGSGRGQRSGGGGGDWDLGGAE